MNKKLQLAILLITFPTISLANTDLVPLPLSGFQIIPLARSSMPDSFKKDLVTRVEEEKIKGYHEEETTYPKYFLSLKNESIKEIRNFKGIDDTHLKAEFSEIKLAFPFKGIPPITKENIIGYAAIGSYITETNHTGWTGIKAFFTDGSIGTCAYSFFNLRLSHGGIQFFNEITRYLINNKPSSMTAKGSNKSGFVYTIDWIDKNNLRELECATMIFDKEIMNKMIVLANKIDKGQL